MPSPSEKSDTQRLGFGMVVVAFVLFIGLLSYLFNDALTVQRNPNSAVNSSVNQGVNEVVLLRNRAGHYVATGKINGKSMELLLDTGASDVSIPGDLANELNLKRGTPRAYNTANGVIRAYQTILKEVQLGNILVYNVRASINPSMRSDQVLLGMTFLKQLEFTQKGDTLTLRQYTVK